MEGFSTRFQEYCCIDRAKSEERKASCCDGGRCGCTKRSQTEYEEIHIASLKNQMYRIYWCCVDDDRMHEMENWAEGGVNVSRMAKVEQLALYYAYKVQGSCLTKRLFY